MDFDRSLELITETIRFSDIGHKREIKYLRRGLEHAQYASTDLERHQVLQLHENDIAAPYLAAVVQPTTWHLHRYMLLESDADLDWRVGVWLRSELDTFHGTLGELMHHQSLKSNQNLNALRIDFNRPHDVVHPFIITDDSHKALKSVMATAYFVEDRHDKALVRRTPARDVHEAMTTMNKVSGLTGYETFVKYPPAVFDTFTYLPQAIIDHLATLYEPLTITR